MMFPTVLLLAGLGLVFGSECESRYGGECHNIFVGCPDRYHYYSYSHCSFLSQCCYNHHTATPSPTVIHPTSNSNATKQGSCGISSVNDDHRIVGGQTALAAEYPWQVSLQYNGYHMCGGTLIDDTHVLTAAHCFKRYVDHWTVVVGTNDIGSVYRSHIRAVEAIYAHGHFNASGRSHNDIAIVKLTSALDLSGTLMRPACLPARDESFANRICTVIGWGATHEEGNSVRYLRKADIPTISNSLCRYYLGSHADVQYTQICAGFSQGGKDSCQGDSGGPLLCQENGIWKVAGVVSWGYGCAERSTPGVYTRVSEYLHWIDTVLQRY